MIQDFLHIHDLTTTPLLLGLSGGPDSRALFHLLLDAEHPFHAAHVDHGWRPESSSEAAALEVLCKERGVPYHSQRLKLEGSNIEDLSRKARHAYFEEVCAAEGLKGVLLAHHADDQAETVLKRVFEGASLTKLSGLLPKVKIGFLTLYRPLLKVRKNEILKWLDEREIPYFLDPTNHDPKYLRSRMRATLLPTLSKQFGKQIETSLVRLAESAGELRCFLEETIDPFLKKIVDSEEAISLDFNQFPEQSPFIYKAVIRALFEQESLSLSTSVLQTILMLLQKNNGRKRIQVGKKEVEMHRGVLTIRKLKIFSLHVATE